MPRPKLPARILDTIRRNAGKTAAQIAPLVGITVAAVATAAKRNGIALAVVSTTSRSAGPRKPKTKAQRRRENEQAAAKRPPREDQRVGPTEKRLRAARAFNERPLLPAGQMSTRGLYSGEGALVGPPGEACYDFDAWRAWSRDPAAWERSREAA